MLARHFTKDLADPYADLDWEYRDISITRPDGSKVFEQKGVHVPKSWSVNAATILAQKYFRGALGTEEREHSLEEVIHRVVRTIAARGVVDGYLVDDGQAQIFMDELSYVLAHQMASFNSPVWFNIGVDGVPQQASACFILSVDDEMRSILNWYTEEGTIFKGGSGSGVNLSRIRSSQELLKGGGTASGPVSFMRGADASAGTIKSGGKCLAPWQRVYTAERGPVPVSELAVDGKPFTVLSYDPPAGRFKAKTAHAWLSGRKPLVKVTTDKGEFFLSPDHPVRLSDMEGIVLAGDLRQGMSLLAATVDRSAGRLRVALRDGRKGRKHLHVLVAQDISHLDLTHRIVHHVDGNPDNNSPENLRAMSQADHAALHAEQLWEVGSHPFQRGGVQFCHKGSLNGMHRKGNFWKDAEKVANYRACQSRIMREERNPRELQRRASVAQLTNTAYRLINEGYDISTFDQYCDARRSHGGWDRSKDKALRSIESKFGSYEKFYEKLVANNHRVISVEPVGDSDVYDVEVICPTPDDKTATSGHNFVIWPNDDMTGSGIAVLNTRRAAAMRILNTDHPDIEEFVWCKATEEHKARALRDAGFDMSLDGKDSFSIQYQNANNSVRVTDEFMEAVLEDKEWELRAVTTGQVVRTVRARDLLRQIAQAAWECGDPGIQFDTTINHWHTTSKAGRINGSNPCFTGETLVATADGRNAVRIDELVGTETPVYAKDAKGNTVVKTMRNVRMTRRDVPIIRIHLDDGTWVDCTPDHRFMLNDGSYVTASELKAEDSLKRFDSEVVRYGGENSDHKVVSVEPAGYADVFDGEVDELHNFAVATMVSGDPRTATLSGVFVHNCSEYLSLDNSSCNLASLNLLSFLGQDGTFDVESFIHTSSIVFMAQDILINHSDYPTKAIAETTRSYRQLGLGYANLGALLMTLGLPYDSESGRALAATLTALMTGVAYKTSAEMASRLGAFPGYAADAQSVLQVLEMHRDAMSKIDENLVPGEIYSAARQSWDESLSLAHVHGVRNAQATLLAPTGTISFLMDCDTTGIEPAFSLVSFKKLIGGGTMVLPIHSVEVALERLGYSSEEREAITGEIANGTSVLETAVRPEHLAIFATAVGDNVITPSGHIKMMGAVQPFLSGGISKTINLPENTTVEEIEETYIGAWEQGLKSAALYRDNCKVSQPLSSKTTKSADDEKAGGDAQVETVIWEQLAVETEADNGRLRERLAHLKERIASPQIVSPVRQRLPRHRRSRTYAFQVGDAEGYVTVGEYDDGRPGELFAKVSKQGSTLAGVMDAFSIAISLGLQHGVPLEAYVRKFTNMRFEPAGMTDDPEIRLASSLVDYIFRRIAIDYLDMEIRQDLWIRTSSERMEITELVTRTEELDQVSIRSKSDAEKERLLVTKGEHGHGVSDSPMCYQCGTPMIRTGSCFACSSCGQTSGCS